MSRLDSVEELAETIRETTAARGLDLWAVDVKGLTATQWAEMTGRDRSTVSRNVRRARDD
jgi:DNA-directed RNA polymerase specialized sigma24 family protein